MIRKQLTKDCRKLRRHLGKHLDNAQRAAAKREQFADLAVAQVKVESPKRTSSPVPQGPLADDPTLRQVEGLGFVKVVPYPPLAQLVCGWLRDWYQDVRCPPEILAGIEDLLPRIKHGDIKAFHTALNLAKDLGAGLERASIHSRVRFA